MFFPTNITLHLSLHRTSVQTIHSYVHTTTIVQCGYCQVASLVCRHVSVYQVVRALITNSGRRELLYVSRSEEFGGCYCNKLETLGCQYVYTYTYVCMCVCNSGRHGENEEYLRNQRPPLTLESLPIPPLQSLSSKGLFLA